MRRINILVILFFALGLAVSARAQQSAVKQKGEPTGYIRIWHFANSIRSRIAVSLIGGATQPVIIARSLEIGRLASYRDVRPGSYRLAVYTASADPNAKPSGPELIPSAQVSVGDHTFQTIVLQDAATRPNVVVFNDGIVGARVPPGGKRLRMFDFAAGQDASLRSLPNKEPIFSHISPGSSQYMFSKNPGAMTIVMSNKLPNGHESQQSAQLDFNRTDSITAVLMFDKYGRLTFQVVDDGRTN